MTAARVPRMDPADFAAQEAPAQRRERFARVDAELQAHVEAKFELNQSNPYEMLVATLLAARSLDSKVNELTPALFTRYPNPAALAEASPETLEPMLKGLMSYRNKARYLVDAAKQLVAQHNGEVPADLAALTALPGVGRKTAVMVLGESFGIQAGIPVDTHVNRVSRRLAFTTAEDAAQIEVDLQELVPREAWTSFAQRLVLHGRYVCVAKNPKCERCPLATDCPSRGIDI